MLYIHTVFVYIVTPCRPSRGPPEASCFRPVRLSVCVYVPLTSSCYQLHGYSCVEILCEHLVFLVNQFVASFLGVVYTYRRCQPRSNYICLP